MEMWDAQSVTFVWFLTSTKEIRVDSIFESFFGEEPAAVQRNKLPTPTNPNLGLAAGEMGDWTIQFMLKPGRLELSVQPKEMQSENGFPVLSTISVLSKMYDSISSNKEVLPPAVRLAIVTNILKPTGSVQESREVIGELLSFDLGDAEYSDLLFQLNRKKDIGGGVEINRLLRWASVVMQSYALHMSNNLGEAPLPAIDEVHAATLLIDVNTVVGTSVFSGSQQIPIWRKMLDETERLGSLRRLSALME